jgi:hypothetical protein
MTIPEFSAFRTKNKEHGLFTTAYRYDKEEIRTANMIGNLYIDFDVNDIEVDFNQVREDAIRTISAFKAIFGIDHTSIQIFFSGNKGVHLVVPAEVLGVQPHDELHMVFKSIAEDMNKLVRYETIDTRIYDKVRLFRVPNSIHPKTGYYKVPITLQELQSSSLEDLKVLAEQPRKPIPIKRTYNTKANRIYQGYLKEWETEKKRMSARRHKGKATTLSFMPPCIQHILSQGAKEGKRNNTVAVLASYFLQRGVKEDEALDRTLDWNDEHVIPQLPAREIENTVRSIYRAEHRYGCQTLSELSICSTSCKLYKDDRRK